MNIAVPRPGCRVQAVLGCFAARARDPPKANSASLEYGDSDTAIHCDSAATATHHTRGSPRSSGCRRDCSSRSSPSSAQPAGMGCYCCCNVMLTMFWLLSLFSCFCVLFGSQVAEKALLPLRSAQLLPRAFAPSQLSSEKKDASWL